jgi:hypothetical protein
VWALAWMGPWWNTTMDNTTLPSAARHVMQSARWRLTSNGTQCSLQPSIVGSKIFPFPEDISTSFVPLIEAQYDEALGLQTPRRTECSVLHLEQSGQVLDYDSDGVPDAYLYNTTAGYHDWVTANLLLSYTLGSASALREQYRHAVPSFVRNQATAHIIDCAFPLVHVRKAEVVHGVLVFETQRGDGIGLAQHYKIRIAMAQCDPAVVYLAGASWNDCICVNGVLVITAPFPVHGQRQEWLVAAQ